MSKEWYEIENIDELDTPALVVYPERVRQNIAGLSGWWEMQGGCGRM